MANDDTLTVEKGDIARMLGIKTETLRKLRALLGDRFPAALPGLPTKWSRRQVELWIDQGGHLTPAEAQASEDEEIARIKRRLEAELGQHP